MKNQNKHPFFAEVIESSLDHYTAQCWNWKQFPTFGSLVSIQDKELHILGIVTNIQTGSMDPSRTPFAYQKTEEELEREQPQIFAFLKTTFSVQACGYIKPTLSHSTSSPARQAQGERREIIDSLINVDDTHGLAKPLTLSLSQAAGPTGQERADSPIIFAIPPTPPKIHAFVSEAPDTLTTQFFADAQFLEVLYGFSNAIQNLDELLLAIIRTVKAKNLLSANLLEEISHGFALLSGNDYRRLKVFLHRIEQIK